MLDGYELACRGPTVVALGGNAVIKEGQRGDIYEQFANTRASLEPFIPLIAAGAPLVLTHGNGPQVGDLLLMAEAARGEVPELPLGVLVADSQGQMGYMFQQSLKNRLIRGGIERDVVTVLTQVVVARDDDRLQRFTKPIGPFFDEDTAKRRMADKGVVLKEDAGRGWRRVVPSPTPRAVVETEIIRDLVGHGFVVIACGGGGIPVYYEEDGRLEGVDAVVDKDLASAVLARDLEAQVFVSATSIEQVFLNFNKPGQRPLDVVTSAEAKRYLEEGHFGEGSMRPKVAAIINFLEGGGKLGVVTTPELVPAALRGEGGTRFVP
ncbi:MAG: carbamate kinase [candidate division Zixibacteria bacterium]|nr:carbamate kinase [candidate division Zixibacteria bacterium]